MNIKHSDFLNPYEMAFYCESIGQYFGDDNYYLFLLDKPTRKMYICILDYDVEDYYCNAIIIQYTNGEFAELLQKLKDTNYSADVVLQFSEEAVNKTLGKYRQIYRI